MKEYITFRVKRERNGKTSSFFSVKSEDIRTIIDKYPHCLFINGNELDIKSNQLNIL